MRRSALALAVVLLLPLTPACMQLDSTSPGSSGAAATPHPGPHQPIATLLERQHRSACSQLYAAHHLKVYALGQATGIRSTDLAAATAVNRANQELGKFVQVYNGAIKIEGSLLVGHPIHNVAGPLSPDMSVSACVFGTTRYLDWTQAKKVFDDGAGTVVMQLDVNRALAHGPLADGTERLSLRTERRLRPQLLAYVRSQLRGFGPCYPDTEPPLPAFAPLAAPSRASVAKPSAEDLRIVAGMKIGACTVWHPSSGALTFYVHTADSLRDWMPFFGVGKDYLDALVAVFHSYGIAVDTHCPADRPEPKPGTFRRRCPALLLFGPHPPVQVIARQPAASRDALSTSDLKLDMDAALPGGDLATGYLGVAGGLATERRYRSEILAQARRHNALEPCRGSPAPGQ